jgi:hypothetical protein
LGISQGDQSALEKVAGFAVQFRYIRHNTQGSQVEQGFGVIAHTGAVKELLGEFISHPAAGQRVERMIGRQQARIDDGICGRQNLGQFVVVGDDHIHAMGFGPGSLGYGTDTRIAGDQQFDTLFSQFHQESKMDTVRFSLTQGNVMADACIQVTQGRDQDGGGGLTVHVEITPDADLFAVANGFQDAVYRSFHTGKVSRGGRQIIIGEEKSACFGWIGDAATNEHFSSQTAAFCNSFKFLRRLHGCRIHPLALDYIIHMLQLQRVGIGIGLDIITIPRGDLH